jgi:putative membrane protein
MDPLMSAGGFWVWEVDGAYFGVPLQNYWGWWLTTFVTFLLFLILGRALFSKPEPQSTWFDQLAIASYLLIGLSNTIFLIEVGMGGPGLAGLFAMLPWVLLSWSTRKQTEHSL